MSLSEQDRLLEEMRTSYDPVNNSATAQIERKIGKMDQAYERMNTNMIRSIAFKVGPKVAQTVKLMVEKAA